MKIHSRRALFSFGDFPEWKERNPLRAEQTKFRNRLCRLRNFCLSHLASRRECSPEGPNVLALSVQIGDDRIAAELVKEAVGAFLLIRDRDVLIHVFAVARPGGDKAADDDVFLQTAQEILLALQGCFRQNLGGFLEGGREMKDEVVRDACVMPRTSGSAVAGERPSAMASGFRP